MGDATSNYKIFKQLERIQLSNDKSPLNQDVARYLDKDTTEEKSGRGPVLHMSELYHYRNESGQTQSSPLRQKLSQKQLK